MAVQTEQKTLCLEDIVPSSPLALTEFLINDQLSPNDILTATPEFSIIARAFPTDGSDCVDMEFVFLHEIVLLFMDYTEDGILVSFIVNFNGGPTPAIADVPEAVYPHLAVRR